MYVSPIVAAFVARELAIYSTPTAKPGATNALQDVSIVPGFVEPSMRCHHSHHMILKIVRHPFVLHTAYLLFTLICTRLLMESIDSGSAMYALGTLSWMALRLTWDSGV